MASRPGEEFRADFERIGRKALKIAPVMLRIFELHFIRGADWKTCMVLLRKRGHELTSGTFWHRCYELKERLGLAFVTVQPYALYPYDGYVSIRSNRAGGGTTGVAPDIHKSSLARIAPLPMSCELMYHRHLREPLDIPDVRAERLAREAAEDAEIAELRQAEEKERYAA